jgi:large subunit ribosomal protein L16
MKGLSRREDWIALGKGRYALQALEPAAIPAETIEAGRRELRRSVADVGICILPDEHVFQNFTKSPWRLRYKIEPGDILYEVWGVTETTARRALTRAASKMPTLPGDTMPIKTRIIYIKIFNLLY